MTPGRERERPLLRAPGGAVLHRRALGRDQVEDYAGRKGVPLAEAERWLRPNLAYEPEPDRERIEA